MGKQNVPLRGSGRNSAVNAEHMGLVPGDEQIDLTVVLRRRAELPTDLIHGRATVASGELADRFGVNAEDLDLVRQTFEDGGLRVTDVRPGARRLTVSGTATDVSAMFGTELQKTRSDDPGGARVEHRSRSGELHIPAELAGIVVAVLGLDNRPQAKPALRMVEQVGVAPGPGEGPGGGYNPPALADIYEFPADTDGSGQVAAVIEFGGGYTPSDLETYFRSQKLTMPKIRSVGVGGADNTPGKNLSMDTEVLLDIEVLGAMAPGTEIVVYFAENNEKGWVDSFSAAIHATPTPTVISLSWSATENMWTAQSIAAMEGLLADAAALGVTICGAAGDDGVHDGQTDDIPHVTYPTSSPHVLAVGGTTLHVDDSGAGTETVWNGGQNGGATGGGVSSLFPVPAWQEHVGVPSLSETKTGRGTPDVAAVADPTTGYITFVRGKPMVVGGTSAAAPLWAALICRLSQALGGTTFGLLQPLLYEGAAVGKAAPGMRDITSGSNGLYQARAGWDACTGLGVPNGAALLTLFKEKGIGRHP